MKRLLDRIEELREENRRLTNQNGKLRGQNETLKKQNAELQKDVTMLTQKNAGLEMMREREMVETSKYLEDLTRQVKSMREYFGVK